MGCAPPVSGECYRFTVWQRVRAGRSTSMEDIVAVTPDPALNANNDLRSLGDALMRISRMLHEHTRKLEVAVEGTYVGQAGDDRVRLLSDSLRVCRTADLELGRLNQAGQRLLTTIQEQLAQVRETQDYRSEEHTS